MSEAPKTGFQAGGARDDLFQSTAECYARFRRPYPEPVVSYLAERFGLDGSGRLLDAGCGTGQVFEVLAKWFSETVAFDADEQMVHYAMQRATELDLKNVNVLKLRADDLDAGFGLFRMAVF